MGLISHINTLKQSVLIQKAEGIHLGETQSILHSEWGVGAERGNSGASQTQQKYELTIPGDLCRPEL